MLDPVDSSRWREAAVADESSGRSHTGFRSELVRDMLWRFVPSSPRGCSDQNRVGSGWEGYAATGAHFAMAFSDMAKASTPIRHGRASVGKVRVERMMGPHRLVLEGGWVD